MEISSDRELMVHANRFLKSKTPHISELRDNNLADFLIRHLPRTSCLTRKADDNLVNAYTALSSLIQVAGKQARFSKNNGETLFKAIAILVYFYSDATTRPSVEAIRRFRYISESGRGGTPMVSVFLKLIPADDYIALFGPLKNGVHRLVEHIRNHTCTGLSAQMEFAKPIGKFLARPRWKISFKENDRTIASFWCEDIVSCATRLLAFDERARSASQEILLSKHCI